MCYRNGHSLRGYTGDMSSTISYVFDLKSYADGKLGGFLKWGYSKSSKIRCWNPWWLGDPPFQDQPVGVRGSCVLDWLQRLPVYFRLLSCNYTSGGWCCAVQTQHVYTVYTSYSQCKTSDTLIKCGWRNLKVLMAETSHSGWSDPVYQANLQNDDDSKSRPWTLVRATLACMQSRIVASWDQLVDLVDSGDTAPASCYENHRRNTQSRQKLQGV